MNTRLELSTPRLSLKPITIKDSEAIFTYRSDALTNQYQGWIPKSIEDVHHFISKIAPKINMPNSWFQFAIVLKETNELIGDIGIHFFDEENCQVELGCTLSKDQQAKGFANEALKTVIDYLFRELNKHRISCSIDPDNTASIKMVERLGFRKEAHFKQSICVDDKWYDDMVYALLRSEWNK